MFVGRGKMKKVGNRVSRAWLMSATKCVSLLLISAPHDNLGNTLSKVTFVCLHVFLQVLKAGDQSHLHIAVCGVSIDGQGHCSLVRQCFCTEWQWQRDDGWNLSEGGVP